MSFCDPVYKVRLIASVHTEFLYFIVAFIYNRFLFVLLLKIRLCMTALFIVVTSPCFTRFISPSVELKGRLAELQIRGGIKDNSKIILLISQPKHML